MQKANAAAQSAVLPKIPPELLDQLVRGPMTPGAIEEASRAFKKALIERALGAEMSHHGIPPVSRTLHMMPNWQQRQDHFHGGWSAAHRGAA